MLEPGTEHKSQLSGLCYQSGCYGLCIYVDKTDLHIVKTPVTTEQFLKGQRPEGDQQVAFVLLNPLGEFKSYKGTFPPESGLGSNRA